MAKIVAIGGRGFVVALAGVGADPIRCEDAAAFQEALRTTALRKDVQIVFAPEPLIAGAVEAVRAFRERSNAALLGLPLVPSERHSSLEEVRYIVEQATGARLL